MKRGRECHLSRFQSSICSAALTVVGVVAQRCRQHDLDARAGGASGMIAFPVAGDILGSFKQLRAGEFHGCLDKL